MDKKLSDVLNLLGITLGVVGFSALLKQEYPSLYVLMLIFSLFFGALTIWELGDFWKDPLRKISSIIINKLYNSLKNVKNMKINTNLQIILPVLTLFIIFKLLFYYTPKQYLLFSVILTAICFLWVFRVYFNKFVASKHQNPIGIAEDYLGVMLVLALIFYLVYILLISGGNGSFYNCDNSTTKIIPGYYFSVSNILSLSYTEPLCIDGPILKGVVALEGILGSVITLIILVLVIENNRAGRKPRK